MMRNIIEDIQNLYRMSNVERFTGTFHHQHYNIAEHCYRTAILFRWWASIEDVAYTMHEFDIVLQHDAVEAITGDLTYPVKNFSEETKGAWAVIEKELTQGTHLEKYSDENIKAALNEKQYALFKCCDYLELLIFCIKEITYGNRSKEILDTRDTCMKLIHRHGKDFPRILAYISMYE